MNSSKRIARLRFARKVGWVTVAVSVFAVLILLTSSLPSPGTWHTAGGSSGLSTASSGTSTPPNATYYPYLIPQSEFPAPDQLNYTWLPNGLIDPQVVSTVINQNPTFLLVGIGESKMMLGHQLVPCSAFYESEGTYSPSLAATIAGGWTKNVPIQWTAPYPIDCEIAPFQEDAIAASPTGNFAVAAVANATTTSVFELTNNATGAWGAASPATVTGVTPQISFGGAAALLVTRTSATVQAATYYVSGIPTVVRGLGYVTESAAGFWMPSSGMGYEGIIASQVQAASHHSFNFWISEDGGYTFNSGRVGNQTSQYAYSPTPLRSAADAVGGTLIASDAGCPGQIAITVDGSTIFLLYTTYVNGQVAVAVTFSATNGTTWSKPNVVAPTSESIEDPALTVSPAGYVYATWLEDSLGNWSVDAAVFSSQGVLIQSPAPVSAGDFSYGYQNSPPSVAVDPFQRPLYIWSGVPTPRVANSNTTYYTGGFLSATNAPTFLQTIPAELSLGDFANQSEGTFATYVPRALGWFTANITSYRQNTSKTNYLCAAQGIAADDLYVNATHITFQNGTDPEHCSLTLVSYAQKVTSGSTGGAAGENPSSPAHILPDLGPMTANTFLAIACDWLLESVGLPVNFSADPLRPVTPGVGLAALAAQVTGSTLVHGETSVVKVTPTALNPTEGVLDATPSFAQYSASWYSNFSVQCEGFKAPFHYSQTDIPSTYSVQVYVDNDSSFQKNFSGGSNLPQVYLSNLTPNATISWWAKYTASYNNTFTTTTCNTWTNYSWPMPPERGMPEQVSVTLSGYITTSLRMVQPQVWTYAKTEGAYFYWNNTMPAKASDSLTTLTHGAPTPTTLTNATTKVWSIAEETGYGNLVTGDWYLAHASEYSQNGSWNRTDSPSISAALFTSSPALTTGGGCQFQYAASSVSVWGTKLSDLNGGNATVTWYASPIDGTSWISFYAVGSGLNITQTALATKTWSGNNTAQYVTEVHGLDAGSVYVIRAVAALTSGCFVQGAYNATLVNTLPAFQISMENLPYDSISHEGGGAIAYWSLPRNVTSAFHFVSGSFVYWNETAYSTYVNMPIASLQPIAADATLFALNITPANANQTYGLRMWLNFSYESFALNLTSYPNSFIYQKDTSGDGLTDAEKEWGWWVPVPNAPGAINSSTYGSQVEANPKLYSTNGLVNDYLEKEYDLDPQTVDTARSHMLDTWNLTFNLKPGGGSVPTGANLQLWYENSSYNPFASTVDYSPALAEHGHPIGGGYNLTNVTSTSAGGLTGGDGSPWAAEVLWNYSALETFLALPSVTGSDWLRGVEGSWEGIPTLTVWGKLSWGANPLVSSSTGRPGLPDGTTLRPGAAEDISIHVTNLYVHGLTGNAAYAAYFHLYSGTNPTGTAEIANYSQPVGPSPYVGCLTNWTAVIPTSQTYQYQTLQVQVLVNMSGGRTLTPVIFNGKYEEANITYDMFAGAKSAESFGNYTASINGTMRFNLTGVTVGEKTPTCIWLPTNNTTTNGLPPGLERYTGEQSFELVLVNASIVVTSDPIPLPWGGTYTVSLNPGLNNFLIPRAEFLHSPLGQAILLGRNASGTSSGTPAMLGYVGSSLSSFGSSSALTNLEAYWQNRSIYTGPGTIPGTTERGTPNGSASAVGLAAATSTASNNTGRVPGDPAIYNASNPAPPALQSILTLNVTGYSSQLDLLVAGLLDNTTNGVNGTFQTVTSYLASLELSAPVLNAIANATTSSEGFYGIPVWHPPAQQPSGGLWGDFVNAATAIVQTAAGAIVSLVGIVYSAAVATFAYFDHLAREAAAFGATLVSRVSAAIEIVGGLLLRALDSLLTWLAKLVEGLLSAALAPFYQVEQSSAEAITGAVDPSGPAPVLLSLSGPAFQLGYVIALIVEVVLGIVTALSFGTSFVLPLIIGLVLSFGIAGAEVTLPSVGEPSPSLVNSWQEFAAAYTTQSPQAANWTSWESAFGYWETGTSTTYAAQQLSTDWNSLGKLVSGEFTVEATAFGLSLLGFGCGLYYTDGGGQLAAICAVTLALVSLGLTALTLRIPAGVEDENNMLALTIAILDGVTIGIAITEDIRGAG